LKETLREQQAHRWSTCSVSHKPLQRPVVSDYAGALYKKDAIIQYLLPAEASSVDKEEYGKILQGRVKSLKDVVEVIFENDKDYKGEGERWICPVTSKVLGPAVKAVYLVPCGHAFSQEAIKEMKGDQCIQCSQSYEEGNVIPILPVGKDEVVFLENRIDRLAEQGLTHSLKRVSGSGKKRKANGATKEDTKADGDDAVAAHKFPGTSSPGPCSTTPHSGVPTSKLSGKIRDASTACLTARVLEGNEAKKKRQKLMGENQNLRSLFTKSNETQKHKDGDFMTRGYSIPANARLQ